MQRRLLLLIEAHRNIRTIESFGVSDRGIFLAMEIMRLVPLFREPAFPFDALRIIGK